MVAHLDLRWLANFILEMFKLESEGAFQAALYERWRGSQK
jgi:hypothetical protein